MDATRCGADIKSAALVSKTGKAAYLMVMGTLTLTLKGEAAAALERLTAEGDYPSPEAALAALLEQHSAAGDPELEHWLNGVGAARYDALKADPSRVVGVAEARAALLKDE